jgi:hypothetical protein
MKRVDSMMIAMKIGMNGSPSNRRRSRTPGNREVRRSSNTTTTIPGGLDLPICHSIDELCHRRLLVLIGVFHLFSTHNWDDPTADCSHIEVNCESQVSGESDKVDRAAAEGPNLCPVILSS